VPSHHLLQICWKTILNSDTPALKLTQSVPRSAIPVIGHIIHRTAETIKQQGIPASRGFQEKEGDAEIRSPNGRGWGKSQRPIHPESSDIETRAAFR
jgi:hypothetical protein